MLDIIHPNRIDTDEWASIEVTTRRRKTLHHRQQEQQQQQQPKEQLQKKQLQQQDEEQEEDVVKNPISFPTPRASRGTRTDIALRMQSTGKMYTTRALVKSRNPTHAYVEDCKRKRIRTNMGYVMFCFKVPRVGDCDGGKENMVFEIPAHKKLPTVAVKMCNWQSIMDFKESGKAEDPLQEVGAMQYVGDNKHVIGCNDLLTDPKYLYVVMPFMPHGDLLGMIYNGTRGGLPQPVARFIFRQLLSTLQYTREWGVVHRDISSENIMLDEQGRCMLIDMGMAVRAQQQQQGKTAKKAIMPPLGSCGKLPYMAPEIFANSQNFDGYAIDLWSAAVVLYSMLTGENESAVRDGCRILYNKPTKSDPIFELLTRQDKQGLRILLDCWDMTMDQDAIDLLQSIFQLNPDNRPSLDEVMNHPWVTNPDVVTTEEMMEYLQLEQFDDDRIQKDEA